MNVTDIDDKNHSVKKFRGESQAFSPALVNEVREARERSARGSLKATSSHPRQTGTRGRRLPRSFRTSRGKPRWLRRDEKFEMHLSTAARTHTALAVALELLASGSHDEHFAHSHPWTPGTARVVTDPFTSWSLAAYWEGQFVRDPDALTRATESVSETVDFVACIVQNGYAYEHEARI